MRAIKWSNFENHRHFIAHVKRNYFLTPEIERRVSGAYATRNVIRFATEDTTIKYVL